MKYLVLLLIVGLLPVPGLANPHAAGERVTVRVQGLLDPASNEARAVAGRRRSSNDNTPPRVTLEDCRNDLKITADLFASPTTSEQFARSYELFTFGP